MDDVFLTAGVVVEAAGEEDKFAEDTEHLRKRKERLKVKEVDFLPPLVFRCWLCCKI